MKNTLSEVSNNVTLKLGIILLVLAMLSDIIMMLFQIPYLIAGLFGGASVLVVIGVLHDVKEQIQAKLEAEQNNCKLTSVTAFDEIEATIQREYLEANDIKCIVEPLRFTWGLPIRTAVDEYRLYVPADKVAAAQDLLK